MRVALKWLRIAGVLALALAIAHCGDSDVRVSTGPGIVPSPGTFTGSLSDGGSIIIEVGSIEEVVFDCDEDLIRETFTPPREIESDGSFNIGFSEGGREFRIRGIFRDNNTVDGTINDEDNECDVSFDAFRGGPGQTPTVVRTPTPGGPTATDDGGPGPTPTDVGPTDPNATRTPTPIVSVSGATPTVTPTASNACPVGVEVLGNAGNQKVLDTGWSGLAHNSTVVQDSKLTFAVDCTAETRPCGTCNVSGPIANPKAGAGDIASQRCSNDSSIQCTDNNACSGGTCIFYFGAPLPLSAGGIGTCVTNQVQGDITGTANIETGAFATTINLSSRVHLSPDSNQPCPVCGTGSGTPNDGNPDGTCNTGPRAGQPCDINGRSPFPAFGNTSLDCPPDGFLTALPIALDGSSGTETRTLEADSPNCTAFLGPGISKKCFCPAQAPGVATQPNACLDLVCTDQGGGEGVCENGPVENYCRIESFRSCSINDDCPASGDACELQNRPCFIDNGEVGGSVSAVGEAVPPTNGRANPTFAALFCIPPVAQVSVNQAAGIPGLGRIELPLQTQEILP